MNFQDVYDSNVWVAVRFYDGLVWEEVFYGSVFSYGFEWMGDFIWGVVVFFGDYRSIVMVFTWGEWVLWVKLFEYFLFE